MKTYQSPLPFSIYLGLAAAYLLFQGVVLWFSSPRAHFLRNNLILLPVGMAFLFWLRYFSLTSQVRVNAEGLEWQQGRVHLCSSWSNVSHLGSRNDGYATTYGLYLKMPMPTRLDPKGLLPTFLIDPKAMDYVPLSGIVLLPIRAAAIDEHALRQTPFGQDLMRWAPQVFNNDFSGRHLSH